MSHRRAPGVPDVPPFRGAGPLQARGVPNQTVMTDPKFIASKAAPAPPSKAMPPPRTTNQNSTSNQQRRPQPISNPSRDSKASSSSSSSQQSRSNRANAESEPRPSSRLANEKKKDYKDPPFIGPWKLGKLIGQGASGRVRHAINTSTGMQAAIKIVPKQILASSRMSIRDVSAKQDKMTLGIEREIVIMKLIEHPNVMGLMDVYETSKELYLILEYVAGGELFDYLVSKGRLRPPEARAYFRQIIFGLHYCHSFNICHRDLKPENLLLDGSKRIVKVADFGMAALQPNEKMLETSCGSPHYASPEIVSGKSYKGTASDIWSCGIILFALLCGRLPFDDPNIQTLLGKVRLGKFDMPDYLESQAKDLIWKMLTVDPEKRLKMRDIMRHPWFTDNGQLSSTNPVSTDLDKLAEEELDMDNLDLDILSNLKTLWPEYSQQDIIDQLMSKGPNWQKTFYSLLVQHRENYSGDDEDEDDDEDEEEVLKSSQGKGNSLGLSLGISQPSPSKTSEQRPVSPAIVSPKITPSVMQNVRPNPTSSPRPISMIQAPFTPSVAQSPVMTSGRTMGSPQVERTMNDENRRPISMIVSPPGSPRRPLPSPKASPVKTMQSPASGFGSAKHAQQALQQQPPAAQTSPIRPVHDRARSDNVVPGRSASPTTPNRSRMRSSSVAEDSTPKQATASSNPPRPSSRASTMRPQSAQGQRNEDGRSNGTQLPSPAIGNTNMQQFFREIADELASIRVNGERPLSLQRKLEQLERMAAEVRSEARSQSPVGKQRSPRRDDDLMAQFDDAEDDVEDAYSVRSGTASEASSNPYSPPTPMTDTYSPALKTKPLAVLDKEIYNGGRMPGSIAMSSGNGSTPGTRTTSVQSSSTTQSNSSTGSGNSLGRRRSLLLGRIKSQRNKTQSAPPATAQGNTAYERLQEAGAKTQQQQGTRMQSRNPGLGLDIGSPALGNVGIKSPTLSVYSAISTGSAPPTPSTPGSVLMTPGSRSSSSHTGGSPKQSWFAGLFNWKPATCTLMSVENFSTTHAETKRLLQSCGARVFVEDSENSGVLKCSLAEKHTMQGNNQTSGQYAESQHSTSSSAKPIRFRVEFQILPMSSINSPAIGSNTPRSIGTSASPRIPNNSFTVNNGNGTVYATSITLVQEKGSLSTFKQIYHSLRELWTLDLPLNSPTMNSSSPAATTGNTLSPTFAATHSPAGIAKVGLGVSMRGASAEHGNNVGGGMTSPRFR